MRLYVGVDPGVSGGWAALTEDRQVVLGKWTDYTEVLAAVKDMASPPNVVTAILEEVHASPQWGVKSTFAFGRNRGMWEMILYSSGISFSLCSPIKWQTALRCRSKGQKNVTKLRARELFPQIASQITHANADALLIAEYNLRVSTGQI